MVWVAVVFLGLDAVHRKGWDSDGARDLLKELRNRGWHGYGIETNAIGSNSAVNEGRRGGNGRGSRQSPEREAGGVWPQILRPNQGGLGQASKGRDGSMVTGRLLRLLDKTCGSQVGGGASVEWVGTGTRVSQEGNGLLKGSGYGKGQGFFKRIGSLVFEKTEGACPGRGRPGGVAMGAHLCGRGEAEGTVFLARPPPQRPCHPSQGPRAVA